MTCVARFTAYKFDGTTYIHTPAEALVSSKISAAIPNTHRTTILEPPPSDPLSPPQILARAKSPAMAASTKPDIFQFQIINNDQSTHIEHTHPVPTFLCTPTQSQKSSQAFKEAFIDVISVVTNQHHDECLRAITTPCIGCGDPTSYLSLAEPMVVVQVTPVCGSKICDYRVRQQVLEMHSKVIRDGEEHEKRIYGKMDCNVCGGEDAKRCAGCGKVAYCGKACQKEDWKAIKRLIRGGN
ncbi:hypothetical protein OEA41_006128 [Lepraria neglecta]|uniref:MYND-type domain-containing protein n=1 Tax=Lepraria neglecta TaxID=209136 RepID=A0AAD9Z8F6_9LECA|nr:hypothetical protein OEA41_006128 [Lepraria neglecta]